MPVPGYFRSALEPPRSGCSCVVVAFLVALLVGGFLLGFGLWATSYMEDVFQTR
jgi:hypothetical protein